jgi:hypothetical protein
MAAGTTNAPLSSAWIVRPIRFHFTLRRTTLEDAWGKRSLQPSDGSPAMYFLDDGILSATADLPITEARLVRTPLESVGRGGQEPIGSTQSACRT